ncbi:DUF1127 domain-containing protein [Hoeflea ulvae]|uniref:DUF1127 domain-containing protein n=1 Tax=Hoeflea ulvae TaxID=2983764 RepID=A0ABT3YDB2_9HYPH|nr:DUF1127 domain-containing protein [Hoeflea ulvae]MCY0093881.1 DUF1127 domain-containing protein [Hoeflea ulvae]
MNARSFAASRTLARSFNAGQVVLNAIYAASGKGTALVRVLLNRRIAGKLQQLSDHQLADIGLTRGDVRCGMSMPFNTDPTTELARRARCNTSW